MRVGWPKCRSDPRDEGHLACLCLVCQLLKKKKKKSIQYQIHSQSHINAVLHAWNCDGFPTTTRIRRSTFSSICTTIIATRMTRTEHHLHKMKAWLDIIGLLFKHPLTTRGWLDIWRERGRGGRGRHACTTFGGACWSWHILLHHGVRVKVDLEALKEYKLQCIGYYTAGYSSHLHAYVSVTKLAATLYIHVQYVQ